MRIDQIHDAQRATPRINLESPEGNRGLKQLVTKMPYVPEVHRSRRIFLGLFRRAGAFLRTPSRHRSALDLKSMVGIKHEDCISLAYPQG